jgi:hypothetical protein
MMHNAYIRASQLGVACPGAEPLSNIIYTVTVRCSLLSVVAHYEAVGDVGVLRDPHISFVRAGVRYPVVTLRGCYGGRTSTLAAGDAALAQAAGLNWNFAPFDLASASFPCFEFEVGDTIEMSAVNGTVNDIMTCYLVLGQTGYPPVTVAPATPPAF